MPLEAPAPSTATPFDYAMTRLYDWDANGGRDGFVAALAVMKSFVDLDVINVEEAVRLVLRVSIDAARDPRDPFLVGFGVQAFIVQLLQTTEDEFPVDPTSVGALRHRRQTRAWAKWLHGRRRNEIQATTEGFEVLLSIALLFMRRRAKSGYSTGDIVRSAQALWAGSIFRSLIEPEAYAEYQRPLGGADGPLPGVPAASGVIERAMFDLILGMSEPGIFTAPDAGNANAMVESALNQYRRPKSMSSVTVAAAAVDAGIAMNAANECFRTSEDLAKACVRHLGANWSGFLDFARTFNSEAIAAAEAVLLWIETVRDEYPHLLSRARFVVGDPAFEEVAHFIAMAMSPRQLGVSVKIQQARLQKACSLLSEVSKGGQARESLNLAQSTWPRSIPL
jgi:hypothetical protein